MDKYAPLAPEEISSPISAPPLDDDAVLVTPIPDDAPAAPDYHSKFGSATNTWDYFDGRGDLLFTVLRFDPKGERKQFFPVTLWREPSGALEWKFKAPPAPRSLYHLDRLSARPSDPVIVCEGEKAADAAGRIFPSSVCVTSPGGSAAAAKADWTPLAGRVVTIWPDVDAAGDKYAATVAAILHDLGCNVEIVDARAVACTAPDGGTREPPQGWDAADAWDEFLCSGEVTRTFGESLETLRKQIVDNVQPCTATPSATPETPGTTPVTPATPKKAKAENRAADGRSFVSFKPFEMRAKGLTIEVEKGRGEEKTIEHQWICAPFEILGATRDPHGNGWGKWLRWFDGDRREHVRHIPEAALQGDASALCALLADEGLRIARGQQRQLATYLSSARVDGRVTLVNRTGWHEIGGHKVFVLPGETIGQRERESVILDASARGPYEARGTLQDWQDGAGQLAGGHALPVLAISASLAGPLLHLAGHEGGGLNFFGPSSLGKTSMLQASASVWGRGSSSGGYVRSWRATANGLEGAAAGSTDTLLALDELGQIDAREMAAALYSLANGTGKARAARDGALREPKSWRALILSSGEIPTSTKMGEDRGRKARAGQLVRLLDIPADRGLGFGCFDNGGQNGDAAALSKAIKAAAIAAYGTAGPEFVRRLIADAIDGETINAAVAGFVAEAAPSGSNGQMDRAAQRLGLIAVAGELATTLGITPWREGEAGAAARWALEQWIAHRGGTDPSEVRQAIEQVRLAIEQHGESRFEAADEADARPVPNRLGWRRGSGEDRRWIIPPEIWKSEICAGLDPVAAARALRDAGILKIQTSGKMQCVEHVCGKPIKAYVLTADILDGGSDGR